MCAYFINEINCIEKRENIIHENNFYFPNAKQKNRHARAINNHFTENNVNFVRHRCIFNDLPCCLNSWTSRSSNSYPWKYHKTNNVRFMWLSIFYLKNNQHLKLNEKSTNKTKQINKQQQQHKRFRNVNYGFFEEFK